MASDMASDPVSRLITGCYIIGKENKMYWNTSDGKTVWKMDSCSCCQMNTAGEHEWNCPLFAEKSLPIAMENWPSYEVPKETADGTHQYFCPSGYY